MIALPDYHTCTTALAAGEQSRVLFRHRHRAEYLPGAPDITLCVAAERGPGGEVRIAATDRPADTWLRRTNYGADIWQFARHFQVPVLELHRPLVLAPVVIPKPWGREIWYTGIEARGQSGVAGEGGQMPLPWLLSIAREEVLGTRGELGLLKILDPLPDPVYGDLYFELHEMKHEVYVVTRVDPDSWLGGKGAIRFGFDPVVRAEHASDSAFRAAYLVSVRNYQDIRNRIDDIQDQWRNAEGIGSHEPVPASILRRWQAALVPELRLMERGARAAMERFTRLLPLRVGDVVRVPPLLPHALQHGVRTVEFQTPVYERRILSFAQKVLTQAHWDTVEAAASMLLEPPSAEVFPVLPAAPGVRREQVARFDDFEVERLILGSDAGGALELAGTHLLVMVVAGVVAFDGKTLGPESAALVPAASQRLKLCNIGTDTAMVLISRPR
jgi:hypothetical protein